MRLFRFSSRVYLCKSLLHLVVFAFRTHALSGTAHWYNVLNIEYICAMFLTSTLSRATLVILMARSPKFKLHFVSLTSLRDGAIQIYKNANADERKLLKSLSNVICTLGLDAPAVFPWELSVIPTSIFSTSRDTKRENFLHHLAPRSLDINKNKLILSRIHSRAPSDEIAAFDISVGVI